MTVAMSQVNGRAFPGERWSIMVDEDEPVTVLCRLLDVNGDSVVQADVASIVRNVYETDTGALVSTATVDVAPAIFNTLQPWDADSIGFNFQNVAPASSFPLGGQQYQVEYVLTMVGTATGPLHVVGRVSTLATESGV